jgi:hypothetical protein
MPQLKMLDELLEAIGLYRGFILDSVEQELSDSPRWTYLRSRLLKCFGDRGLEGRIKEIIQKHPSYEKNHE